MRWNRGLTKLQKFEIEQKKRGKWRKTFVWIPTLCQDQRVWLEFIYVQWTGTYAYGRTEWDKHTAFPENIEGKTAAHGEDEASVEAGAARRGPTVFKK